MEAAVPIPVTMSSGLARTLRHGDILFRSREVFIHVVVNSGDVGGIMCGITPSREPKAAVVVALTHLRISLKHPLGAEIRAYQLARKIKLAQQIEEEMD